MAGIGARLNSFFQKKSIAASLAGVAYGSCDRGSAAAGVDIGV